MDDSETNSVAAGPPCQCRLKLDGVPDYPLMNVPFKIEVSLIDDKDKNMVGPEMTFQVDAYYVGESYEAICAPDVVKISPEGPFKIGHGGCVELTVTITEPTMDAKDRNKVVLDFKVDQASVLHLPDGILSVLDARTQPMVTTKHKLVIEEIATVPYVWYKDEGGHKKCIDARILLQSPAGDIITNRRVPLIATLMYANGQVAMPMESTNSRALLELSHESTMAIDEKGEGFVKYRINEVSSTHGRKQFRLFVAPDPAYPENADICPALTVAVEVKSKRNGRRALLAAQTAAMLQGRDPEEVCPTPKTRRMTGPILSGRAGILKIGKGGSNGAAMVKEAISWVNKVIEEVELLKQRSETENTLSKDMLSNLETHVLGGKATIEATMQNLHTLIIASAAVSDSFPLKLVRIPKQPKPEGEENNDKEEGEDDGEEKKDSKASKSKKETTKKPKEQKPPKEPKEPKEAKESKKPKAKGKGPSDHGKSNGGITSELISSLSGGDHLSTLSSLALALHQPPVPAPADNIGGGLMSLLVASTSLMGDAMDSSHTSGAAGRAGKKSNAAAAKAKNAKSRDKRNEATNHASEVDDEDYEHGRSSGARSGNKGGSVKGKGGKKTAKNGSHTLPTHDDDGDDDEDDIEGDSDVDVDVVFQREFTTPSFPYLSSHSAASTHGKSSVASSSSLAAKKSKTHPARVEENDEHPKKRSKASRH